MAQLPFLVHADFLLPSSWQSVTDNSWNRKLRDEIVYCFALVVEDIVLEDN